MILLITVGLVTLFCLSDLWLILNLLTNSFFTQTLSVYKSYLTRLGSAIGIPFYQFTLGYSVVCILTNPLLSIGFTFSVHSILKILFYSSFYKSNVPLFDHKGYVISLFIFSFLIMLPVKILDYMKGNFQW